MVKRRVSTEDSVLLMSPQVIYGRPGPRLERIHRGEVQGILTEHSSSAWQIGEVVGYAPMEKPRETFNPKSFFTDWSGFTWYVLGPLLRMVFWVALLIAPVSPMFLSQGPWGISEEIGTVILMVIFIPPLLLIVGFVGLVAEIWLLLLCVGKFLNAVGDAVESTRLLVRQHKIQQDFQFRLVYECTPLDGGSAEALLHRILESHQEEES
ncbi:hypothetical protein [Rothia mucilaginosa]|uniref:hypothetical protein n=1 Tax=Rothia mucilaginosa TaxID=43675 RepID=UPI003C70990A